MTTKSKCYDCVYITNVECVTIVAKETKLKFPVFFVFVT